MSNHLNASYHDQRYLVLLDQDRLEDSIQAINQRVQLAETMRVATTAEASEGILEPEQIDQSDLVIFDRLGIALVNQPLDTSQSGALIAAVEDTDLPILAVTADELWYAYEEPELPNFPDEVAEVSLKYLAGYRDGVNQLIERLVSHKEPKTPTIASINESSATWGLQITKVLQSRYSGRGVRVAVLDTGMDLQHPDFVGRKIVSQSFISGVATAQDGNGHGTHCIGTACGPRQPNILPRYGVAYESEIYAGKVLADNGSGWSSGIVAGINWAIANNCPIISMSLGSRVSAGQRYDNFYEIVGQRALRGGSLIIAAAGNDSNRPRLIAPVGSPANCPSIMAVAALDSRLQVARFSNGGTNPEGGEVDIVAPGVDVYSSYPMPTKYQRLNGTSMATPHVAGIAALYAQATGQRGDALWRSLISHARRLSLPSRDGGSGLVQAP